MNPDAVVYRTLVWTLALMLLIAKVDCVLAAILQLLNRLTCWVADTRR